MTKQFELYDGKVTVAFIEGTHRYKVLKPSEQEGYKLGVTTTLKVLNKPELLQWASNMAVDTFAEAWKSSLHLWGQMEFKELCKQAKYAHMTYRDARALIGTNIHQWIEKHIAGEDVPYADDMAKGVNSFLEWESTHKPEYIHSERVLYSQKHDYCGTMDAAALIDGKKTIIDFKTGEPDKQYDLKTKRYTGRRRARSEHFMQEGAYSIPLKEELGFEADQLMTLYLPSSGNLYVFSSPFVEFWEKSFIDTLSLYRKVQKANKLNTYEGV